MSTEVCDQGEKSYGLVFIQPEGIKVGLDVAFRELCFREVSRQDFASTDFPMLLKQMFDRYPPHDLERFICDLYQSNVILSLQRDSGYDRVWDINYADFSQSVYYTVLRNSLKGDFQSFLLESAISDQEMKWFLKNLKGDKRILSIDRQNKVTEIQRPGKEKARGLRSLITNRAYDISSFETLSPEQQKEVVVRFVHTCDDLSAVLDSLKILAVPPLSVTELQEIDMSNLETKVKIKKIVEGVHRKYALDCGSKGGY